MHLNGKPKARANLKRDQAVYLLSPITSGILSIANYKAHPSFRHSAKRLAQQVTRRAFPTPTHTRMRVAALRHPKSTDCYWRTPARKPPNPESAEDKNANATSFAEIALPRNGFALATCVITLYRLLLSARRAKYSRGV